MRVALVPGVLAFLPEYGGIEDPVADVRAASLAAVAWLAEAGPVTVVADAQGTRVGRHLVRTAGGIVGEGSAFTARVDARTAARVGEPLRLSIDPAGFYWFDPDTGASLHRRAASAADKLVLS